MARGRGGSPSEGSGDDVLPGVPEGAFGAGLMARGGIAGATPPSPEKVLEEKAAYDDYLAEHDAKETAKYDSMNEEQREKYYVRPGILTRIKQFWTGT